MIKDDQLREAVRTSKMLREVCKKLKVTNKTNMSRRIRKLGIDTSHFTYHIGVMTPQKVDDVEFARIVKEQRSYSEVSNAIYKNIKEIGKVSRRASRLGLDISHFKKCYKRRDPNSALSFMYGRYRVEAKRRNYDFQLSKADFEFLTAKPCYYCDKDASESNFLRRYDHVFKYNGIDRADNSKGYVWENVVPCCRPCNTKKQACTIEMAKKLAAFNGNPYSRPE